MTDRQGMLFPPLEDDDDSRSLVQGQDNNKETLPQDIKDRFSEVRSLLRDKSSKDTEDAAELKRKQEAAALQAAMAVEAEMARLQNGIAELEAMYAMQQQSQLQQGDDFLDDESVDDEDDDGLGGMPVVVGDENGIAADHYNRNMMMHDHNDNNRRGVPSLVQADERELEQPETHSSGSRRTVSRGDRRPESERVATTQDILCDA